MRAPPAVDSVVVPAYCSRTTAGCATGTAGDGVEHAGDSRVVSPMGELLATASGIETLLVAEVDPAEVAATRGRFRFLADRRS